MSATKRRLDQLKVVSPCSTDWDLMSGDEKRRFCSECDKFVYDFSQMTWRQVEAIVSIHQGRMCARITRRPDGSLLTLETPPANSIAARRASPVINATLAAILGLSSPVSAISADVSATQFIARFDADHDRSPIPNSGGEGSVGGTVFDQQGAAIPNAAVKLISEEGVEFKTKTSAEGEFTFAKVPFGSYIMLVEAHFFYTYVNSSVIVDTPYDMRFDVTMKSKRFISIGGGMGGIPPQSLLDLYRQSDLVAIAHVGRSVVAGTDDELKTMLIKTDLHIFSQLKGENSQQVIPYYYSVWGVDPDMFKPAPGFVEKFHHIMRSVWGPNPGTFKQGESLLVFLEHRESKDGKRLGGYKATGWGISSIKKLDDEALAIYRHRIEDLALILLRGAPDPAELVEWLVRCVEESATREEGILKLSGILSLPSIQRERESAAESSPSDVEEPADQSEGDVEDPSEQAPGAGMPEWEKEKLKLAAALTQDHKTRLANALFAISDLSEADMNLVSLIQKLDDGRFAPYLVSQLHRIADRAPRFAESLVWRIAEVTNDEDLKQLANDYDDAAKYDESEDERESGQQDSTRNQRTDGVTIATIERSARLKDFLKLVEYKTKL